MRYAVLALALLTTACAVTAESWPKQYATAVCDVYTACEDEFGYGDYFDNRADCVTIFEGQLTSYSSYYEQYGCDFDSKAAKACLASIRKVKGNCDDGISGGECYEVWDCY